MSKISHFVFNILTQKLFFFFWRGTYDPQLSGYGSRRPVERSAGGCQNSRLLFRLSVLVSTQVICLSKLHCIACYVSPPTANIHHGFFQMPSGRILILYLSVSESQFGRVAQFVQIGNARKVDHGRRSAHHHKRIVGRRIEMSGHHFRRYESGAVFPS